MRRLVLLAGLASAVVVLLPGSAVAGAGGSDLPLEGSHSGYAETNLLTGQAHFLTTGPVSHFGSSTMDQHVQFVPTGPTTFTWFSTWTLTAASGDQMLGTAVGTGSYAADGVHVTSLGTYTASDGTGRFADATMTFHSIGQGTVLSVEGPNSTSFWEVTAVGRLSH